MNNSWKDVKELLPKDGRYIICYKTPFGEYRQTYAYYNNDEKSWRYGDGVRAKNVTHWMEKPTLPNGKKD